MTLPGWNSIGAVTKIHDTVEISGFVLLGLLALLEACQYIYGHRRETLAGIAQAAKSSSVAQQIDTLKARATPWQLTEEQRLKLIEAVMPFPGQPVVVSCLAGDKDGETFAEGVQSALKAAGWHIKDFDQDIMIGSGDRSGIAIGVNERDVVAKAPVIKPANALAEVFYSFKLISFHRTYAGSVAELVEK